MSEKTQKIVSLVLYVIGAAFVLVGMVTHSRAVIFGGLLFVFLTSRLSKALKQLTAKEDEEPTWLFLLKKVFGNQWSILFIGLWLIIFIL
ncbi:MAG TPA: hypothetical protein PKZ16_02245 [bacterium]|nr:hypothetical protein [bacterium]HPL95568.1 hypothetical protein [bacterium]